MASYTARGRERKQKKQSHEEKIGLGNWVAIQDRVLDSEEFSRLSGSACKLLFEFIRLYRRINNGDLSISFDDLSKRGWKSKTTLFKARDELIEARFIILTRQGGKGGLCNLYALTFYSIDECLDKNGFNKIHVSPTRIPPDYWMDERKPKEAP